MKKFIDRYGKKIILILFGIFAILASLYEKTYSDYGDSIGTELRNEPVWWVLIFGVFVVIAGILTERD